MRWMLRRRNLEMDLELLLQLVHFNHGQILYRALSTCLRLSCGVPWVAPPVAQSHLYPFAHLLMPSHKPSSRCPCTLLRTEPLLRIPGLARKRQPSCHPHGPRHKLAETVHARHQ